MTAQQLVTLQITSRI